MMIMMMMMTTIAPRDVSLYAASTAKAMAMATLKSACLGRSHVVLRCGVTVPPFSVQLRTMHPYAESSRAVRCTLNVEAAAHSAPLLTPFHNHHHPHQSDLTLHLDLSAQSNYRRRDCLHRIVQVQVQSSTCYSSLSQDFPTLLHPPLLSS